MDAPPLHLLRENTINLLVGERCEKDCTVEPLSLYIYNPDSDGSIEPIPINGFSKIPKRLDQALTPGPVLPLSPHTHYPTQTQPPYPLPPKPLNLLQTKPNILTMIKRIRISFGRKSKLYTILDSNPQPPLKAVNTILNFD